MSPIFNELGLFRSITANDTYVSYKDPSDEFAEKLLGFTALEHLFGRRDIITSIFSQADNGYWDEHLFSIDGDGEVFNDKDLLLARMDYAIKLLQAVTS